VTVSAGFIFGLIDGACCLVYRCDVGDVRIECGRVAGGGLGFNWRAVVDPAGRAD
jgi:hypothetical protein